MSKPRRVLVIGPNTSFGSLAAKALADIGAAVIAHDAAKRNEQGPDFVFTNEDGSLTYSDFKLEKDFMHLKQDYDTPPQIIHGPRKKGKGGKFTKW